MTEKLKSFLVPRETTIKEAMRAMAEVGQREIFVVDGERRLFGALSDGDIRKWILKEGRLNERVENICNKQPKFVGENFDFKDVKNLMLKFKIECIPVLRVGKIVKDILVWSDVFTGEIRKQKEKVQIPVIIMAGGKGTRLDPFTKILPKPLVPIGDKPIIELIMDKFSESGIRKFYFLLNYKARMIKSYFEEADIGYDITFIEEKTPLGTAGGLKLLEGKVKGPFLVTNSDVIIDSDYSELVHFHKTRKYDLTMVVSCRHYVIPYGVCEIENGGSLKVFNEKPEYDLLVNTGMYVVGKNILKDIVPAKHFDMNDLIAQAKKNGRRIGVFPIPEKSWIDIGQWEEYHKACERLRQTS